MRTLGRGLLCSFCCLLALSLPATTFAQAPEQQQQARSDNPPDNTKAEYSAAAELPDSPGSSRAQPQNAASTQQNTSTAGTDPAKSQSNEAPNAQQDQKLQRPVGTAAAEAPRVSGITAAEPAGIAIAPAKQHRVRTIAIRVGAIIGAGAALGTVIALTQATPSKPPGAH